MRMRRDPFRTRRSLVRVMWIAALLAPASVARAEPSQNGWSPAAPEPRRSPVAIDVEGPVELVSGGEMLRCRGPCTVEVATGLVEIRAGGLRREVFVDGPSRVRATPGAPALRSVGLVALVAGVAVVLVAVVVPLAVCRTEYVTSASGRSTSSNPCRDVSDGAKAAWIAGAGVGLTAAIFGGITYTTAGPSLRLEPAPSPSGAARARFTPWLELPNGSTAPGSGTHSGIAGGLAVMGRF